MHSDTQTVLDYIFGLTIPGVKLELSRVKAFMDILGNPHQAYPVIHIAGTNGKGSTAAMLAAILNAYEQKTGVFTSPHLLIPNERIRIADTLVPDHFIIEKVESWRPHIEKLGITFFEVLTALGMVYFEEQNVEYAVIETGLGGRLDATNVVDPAVSIITAVSMDHENILGDNIEQIASEKAGIIKVNRPVVLGKNSMQVQQVIKKRCKEQLTDCVYVPDVAEIVELSVKGTSQWVKIRIGDQLVELTLPLLGLHQVENFTNVLVTLNQLGLELNSETIQAGLDEMHWWGRIQPLQTHPLVLYDVAHNPEGLERLLESLKQASLGDTILIATFNARKNIQAMLELLKTWQDPILFTLFEGHSSIGNETLIKQGVDPTLIFQTPKLAYDRAMELKTKEDQAICYFGSHYLAESLFALFDID